MTAKPDEPGTHYYFDGNGFYVEGEGLIEVEPTPEEELTPVGWLRVGRSGTVELVMDPPERAIELYEAAGNPRSLWHAEDEITRLYYLRLAASSDDTPEPLPQPPATPSHG